ncbi:aminodeoxychorismate synthase component I [Vibrio sp. SS-MA-C1-2]|uniref:aminodeoxychorismate synthase component I n=1 Tax=Vibrio sp. SS-MA-C1-2 TaxID=2908646 RepID=UPI001F294A70|nr:aminodeoxychorismate synthase component I [Vibrio sp. SS-MA-C1-2]UJF17588.1 aminodeoxychorismate synthase component I [Vibrio sp. SS-MA-C1-2]
MKRQKVSILKTTSLKYCSSAALSLFDALASQPWAMLLHSADNRQDSRFDIIVADPIVTIESYATHSIIKEKVTKKQFNSETDPFTLLAQLQQHYLPAEIQGLSETSDLPFIGGALGYFAYDLGRTIEPLTSTSQHDIPAPDMAIGLYDWAIIIDHQQEKITVVEPEQTQRITWLEQQKIIHNRHIPALFSLTSSWQSNMSEQEYGKKFDAIQNYLKSGDCYQINLAQRFQAHYQGDEWLAYQQLSAQNGAPFSSFIRLDEFTLLSLSPERFIQLANQQIETKPIKGTRPRFADPQQDLESANQLQHAEKDQAENLMIVDLLRNDIGRVAKPGTVAVPSLFAIESYPAVHHLVSTITATLDQKYSGYDLLRACFPGGSITGAPKIRAMEIIEELEPHRRNSYCGSIGYISRDGTLDTNIAIRTLLCHENSIYAWAGGGIVADSQQGAEYKETFDKLAKILPILNRVKS